MRLFPAVLLAAFVAAVPPAARADPAGDLDAALRAGDAAAVERQLVDAQAAFVAGERSADEIRALYTPFTRTRPETLALVDAWLTRDPASAEANAAMAWLLHTRAWDIRGKDAAGHLHPQALAEFEALQATAWRLADRAHAADPRLIAASDALILLGNPAGHRTEALAVLDKVMERDPNFGTLWRGLGLAHAGWGGTWRMAEGMCETHAARVPDAEPSPVLSCLVRASLDHPDRALWREETLLANDLPHLDRYLLGHLLRPDAPEADVARARRVLLDEDRIDLPAARLHDMNHAGRFGFGAMQDVHEARARAKAEAELEDDPYNPDLLDALIPPVMAREMREDGEYVGRVVSRAAPEVTVDLAERAVVAQPYTPERWTDLWQAMARTDDAMQAGKGNPYRVNAVVYANHRPEALLDYLRHQAMVYDAWGMMARGELKGGEAMFAGTEPDRDILCPFVRAERLFRASCAAGGAMACAVPPEVGAAFDVILADAEARGACMAERTSPVAALAFTPDLSVRPHR